MRVMAYMGMLMLLVAVVGAWLYWKQKLERARWFHWAAIVAIVFPYIAATAGWILTEMGRQPWIVQGLLKTADAHSPSVSSTMLAFSLAMFVCLYLLLLVLNIWLMRRYAKVDPPEPDRDETGETPEPAIGY
jgi:cytochrome d ubiquinol oxidase subunit I